MVEQVLDGSAAAGRLLVSAQLTAELPLPAQGGGSVSAVVVVRGLRLSVC